MFERYTEKARRVIFFGRYEASQFGSPYIETEHLLLGLLREDKALVNRFFRSVDAIQTIRKEIEGHTVAGEKTQASVDLPLSNESKRVLAYAPEEAERLGHKHIGTEHLLLGLLREEKCFAAMLLRDHNVNLEQARQSVREPEAPGAQRPHEGPLSSPLSSEFGFGPIGTTDLTRQAMDGILPPLIGRERELQRTLQILCRLTRPNPLLVGEPGVGKRAIVNGLAQRISDGMVPALDGRRVLRVDLAAIGWPRSSRTWFEDQLHGIVFIANLPKLAQAPQLLGLANAVKPAVQTGAIQCISAATPGEYSKAVEAEPWLEHEFSVIEVKPATEEETSKVLAGVKERFEKFHGVTYSEEALQYAVFHASSHFADRYLPEKAIDLMDEAGARVKLRQESEVPNDIREVKKRIRFTQNRHSFALKTHEIEKARFYEDELNKQRESLKELQKKYSLEPQTAPTVTREDIDQYGCREDRSLHRGSSQINSSREPVLMRIRLRSAELLRGQWQRYPFPYPREFSP